MIFHIDRQWVSEGKTLLCSLFLFFLFSDRFNDEKEEGNFFAEAHERKMTEFFFLECHGNFYIFMSENVCKLILFYVMSFFFTMSWHVRSTKQSHSLIHYLKKVFLLKGEKKLFTREPLPSGFALSELFNEKKEI